MYSPADVLASNFHAGHKQREASEAIVLEAAHAPPNTAAPLPEDIEYSLGVSKKHLNIFDCLALVGVRAHWAYWQDQPEVELSCFHQIVAALYQNDSLLT